MLKKASKPADQIRPYFMASILNLLFLSRLQEIVSTEIKEKPQKVKVKVKDLTNNSQTKAKLQAEARKRQKAEDKTRHQQKPETIAHVQKSEHHSTISMPKPAYNPDRSALETQEAELRQKINSSTSAKHKQLLQRQLKTLRKDIEHLEAIQRTIQTAKKPISNKPTDAEKLELLNKQFNDLIKQQNSLTSKLKEPNTPRKTSDNKIKLHQVKGKISHLKQQIETTRKNIVLTKLKEPGQILNQDTFEENIKSILDNPNEAMPILQSFKAALDEMFPGNQISYSGNSRKEALDFIINASFCLQHKSTDNQQQLTPDQLTRLNTLEQTELNLIRADQRHQDAISEMYNTDTIQSRNIGVEIDSNRSWLYRMYDTVKNIFYYIFDIEHEQTNKERIRDRVNNATELWAKFNYSKIITIQTFAHVLTQSTLELNKDENQIQSQSQRDKLAQGRL